MMEFDDILSIKPPTQAASSAAAGVVMDDNESIVVHVDTWRTCLRAAFAEFVGSAVFVYVSCGAGANTSQFYNPGPVIISIALASGLTLFVLGFMIGHISGAHLNPVISISFIVLNKVSMIRGCMYACAQFFGTLIGMAFLRASTPSIWHNTATALAVPNCLAANRVAPGISAGVAFFSEMVLTFFLLMVVCAATDSKKSNQTLVPLALGICVTCCLLMGIPIDGCSMNPTRSFAAAAVARGTTGCEWVWDDHWVFWFGPFFGGAIGSIVYDFIFHDSGRRGENLMDQYVKPHVRRA